MDITRTSTALLVLFTGLVVRGEPPADGGPQTLDDAWEALGRNEPEASRALLRFVATPAETVAFLKTHLKPLTLSDTDLEVRLKDLASDDEPTWKAAFAYFEYFDPRLNTSLSNLMDRVKNNPARSRLVAVLSDRLSADTNGRSVELRLMAGDAANFFDGTGSWWAETRVSRLAIGGWSTSKRLWTRAIRAVVLLQHLNTPEAQAVVADVATGHADALPTQVAKTPGLAVNAP